MPQDDRPRYRHILLPGRAETEPFRSPSAGGGSKSVPERDRQSHGAALLRQLQALRQRSLVERRVDEPAGQELGLVVEFESFPDIELAFESLARERSGIELLNVRHEAHRTEAAVYVPEGKLVQFEKLVRDYLSEKRDRRGNPRDNRKLIDTIQAIRAASLRGLWTDDPEQYPRSEDEILVWEVWLPVRRDRRAVVEQFLTLAGAQELRVSTTEVTFPERTVLLVSGSARQMQRSAMMLNTMAELRRGKETAEFFDSFRPEEQQEWVQELLHRTRFPSPSDQVPHVCLLDTGVNYGHPLLAPALASADAHTVEPAWGTNDAEGHGTNMAGLALLGDLSTLLGGSVPVNVPHRLESVKLLRRGGDNSDDPMHHAALTTEAVARPEVSFPDRARVFSMAVTAKDARDRGRPSAWSAALDRLASDADDEGRTPRLLIVSAGNVTDPQAWAHYPDSNSTDGVHDPGQAWNALTVGACTDLVTITDPESSGYRAVAPAGGLSPFSTTSIAWQANWPIKPDVVFEGGNVAIGSLGAFDAASLSLLTTNHLPNTRLLTTANATSAASALGSRMAAQLMAAYPRFRPETIRGLMVHSAEWTDAMQKMFLLGGRRKQDYLRLIRHCGYGAPTLERAIWSASNSLTLIAEEELHPFKRVGSKEPSLRDMHLHRLPWPTAELEALGETGVEMRVTLSYFIEPNPSRRGVTSRYRYESHGLRFDVKRPTESEEDFRSRVNLAARDEEEGLRTGGDDSQWLIGKQNRHKGSLHSDRWRGTAADLAHRGALAVYPALGWWKTRPALTRFDKSARYSLLISIHSPSVAVDLYTPVATQVGVVVEIDR